MTSNDETGQVFGGVDTHDASIHVAVINDRGRDLGDLEFPTTAAGYRRALAFVASYGDVAAAGSRARRPMAPASLVPPWPTG